MVMSEALRGTASPVDGQTVPEHAEVLSADWADTENQSEVQSNGPRFRFDCAPFSSQSVDVQRRSPKISPMTFR